MVTAAPARLKRISFRDTPRKARHTHRNPPSSASSKKASYFKIVSVRLFIPLFYTSLFFDAIRVDFS